MTLEKQIYLSPILESPPNYRGTTGVSLPIGTSANRLELDFMEGEQ